MNDVQRLALIFGQPLIIGLLLTLVARSGIYELFTETQSILFTLMSGGIWMGLLNTIQEVNKERVILKREYMGNLKLPIYMLSKYIVQGVISLIQDVYKRQSPYGKQPLRKTVPLLPYFCCLQ